MPATPTSSARPSTVHAASEAVAVGLDRGDDSVVDRPAVCLSSQIAHPIMFDEADPFLGRVRPLALALPEAAEKVSHGRPAFFTTKMFAHYGTTGNVDPAFCRSAFLFCGTTAS